VFAHIDANWLAFSPPLVLLITAMIALLFALMRQSGKLTAILSLVGIVFAGFFNTELLALDRQGSALSSFGLSYLADNPDIAFNFVILLGVTLAVLMSYNYLERTGLEHPEYYPLLLLSSCGAMIMAAAGDFIVLVLGLEIMSLAIYVLSAWRQGSRESEEAGLKYFLLGAFASAFLIYGVALMYGATGHFNYAGVVAALTANGFNQELLATLGGMLILGGLAFKAAMAPFQQWAPDAYTGAPTPVTGFMSVVIKAGAFAALLRVFVLVFPHVGVILTDSFWGIVALTLIVGNFAALLQRGVKRMLAYSAVGHAGYLGLAVISANQAGMQAAIWYLTAYTLMTAGAFAIVALLGDKNDHGDDLERFAGLGRTRPYLAGAMAVLLLSMAGIPPLAGFIGKILVFEAAISAGYIVLAIVAIITSVVAIAYYFRVIAVMYFREPEYQPLHNRSAATGIAISIAVVGTVVLGILPGWWYGLLQAGQQLVAGL
jgi:NADH-quinone oxidoreductase subunit N